MAADPTDLASMLNLIVLSAVQMLRGSAGAVALWDERRQRLGIEAGYGLDGQTLASLHPRLDRAILDNLGRIGEMVSVHWIPPRGSVASRQRLEQILALPLGDEDGRLVGVIYVFRHPSAAAFEPADLELLDLFARQAATAIRQARLASATLAEKSRFEAMQSSFVSIVSHELQTPVAIIKAYAGTLARPDAPWSRETVTRVAHTIEEECDRLHRLITDLLDLSRIQAGRVAMTMGPVDLADLAETVAERSRTRSPQHAITTDFPADFPIIRGDREKLRQALGNLVDNAIKYSPENGPIVIGGRAERDHVIVTVHDEGIGIPTEERERIFERFHRVDTRLSRTTSGVGLGLYICKVIVEAHGGQIWVESPGTGRGSTFFIRLPR
jgi:signal transduction histidine kinase